MSYTGDLLILTSVVLQAETSAQRIAKLEAELSKVQQHINNAS